MLVISLIIACAGSFIPPLIYPNYDRLRAWQQVLLRLAVLLVVGLIIIGVLVR